MFLYLAFHVDNLSKKLYHQDIMTHLRNLSIMLCHIAIVLCPTAIILCYTANLMSQSRMLCTMTLPRILYRTAILKAVHCPDSINMTPSSMFNLKFQSWKTSLKS